MAGKKCSMCDSDLEEHFECAGDGEGLFGKGTCGDCYGTGLVCSRDSSHNWRTGAKLEPEPPAPPSAPVRAATQKPPEPPQPSKQAPVATENRTLAERIGCFGWSIIIILSIALFGSLPWTIALWVDSLAEPLGQWANYVFGVMSIGGGVACGYLWFRLRSTGKSRILQLIAAAASIWLVLGGVLAIMNLNRPGPVVMVLPGVIFIGLMAVEVLLSRKRDDQTTVS